MLEYYVDSQYYQKGNPNAPYQKPHQIPSYFQNGKPKQDGPTIAERKQSSNCYHCGQQGHWASECPIKDIQAYDQDFWNDIDSLVGKEMQIDEAPQTIQEEPQPVPQAPQIVQQAPQPAPPAPKKRKLTEEERKSVKMDLLTLTNFSHFCVVLHNLLNILHAFSICVLCLSKIINFLKEKH